MAYNFCCPRPPHRHHSTARRFFFFLVVLFVYNPITFFIMVSLDGTNREFCSGYWKKDPGTQVAGWSAVHLWCAGAGVGTSFFIAMATWLIRARVMCT